MNKYINIYTLLIGIFLLVSCADNELDENPNDDNFPFRIVVDAEEGGDLPDAEDYDLEIAFADYLGDLPASPIVLNYAFTDIEEDFSDIEIDEIVYEIEIEDCVYERELEFTVNGSGGTITLTPDPETGTVPESFEIIFALPGDSETEGTFTFELTGIETDAPVILGQPATFTYEVLDSELAGEWELEIDSEEAFDQFKAVFGPLNPDLENLTYEEITGKVTLEFEYEEAQFVVELKEEEEVTQCVDGELESEIVNKEIEIETEYDADDGELEFEGSHIIVNEEGEEEAELDFIVEAAYEVEDDETLSLSFFKVVDEDNFADGEELFVTDEGAVFTFEKD